MLLLREEHPGLASELKATLTWQIRDCRKADRMHKRSLPSVSSSAVVETGLKDVAGAALRLVSLHLSVLCSITQYVPVAGSISSGFSPSCPEKGIIEVQWETRVLPRVMLTANFYSDFVQSI